MKLEWQAAEGSRTLHLIDADATPPRSGRRARCGRYPQRFGRETWFSLPSSEYTPSVTGPNYYGLIACRECLRKG